jgi:hypothetical protein
MKSDRPDKVAMSSQREDACRSTAIRVQQPQLGVFVIAASQKDTAQMDEKRKRKHFCWDLAA